MKWQKTSNGRKIQIRQTKIPFTAIAMTTLLGVSGFTFVPDIDRANHKNVPTYNNAGLNDSTVTATDMTPLPNLAKALSRQVPGVHHAIVIQRYDTLYAGVDTGSARNSRTIINQARQWLMRQDPRMAHVYVSADPTLVNHFYRYAADRAAHLKVGSDIIMSDIEREFPGAK